MLLNYFLQANKNKADFFIVISYFNKRKNDLL